MSYKTVLVHVDESKHASQRIRLAADIAARQDAHLIAAATTGVSRYIQQAGMLNPADPGMAQHLATHLSSARERALQCLRNAEQLVAGMPLRALETPLIDDEAGAGLSLRGRYSDLVVIGQYDPDEVPSAVLPDFPEYMVLNAGRPVLIVPYAGRFEVTGRRVLVAWDASVSATRAVTNAIPLLKQADMVDIAVFNPGEGGDAHGEQPGADIALYLARHGIKVNVATQNTDIAVGEALLSYAADLGSDMLVMGGYGHSRFREILLGGVTRTVLQSMTLPVLMSG